MARAVAYQRHRVEIMNGKPAIGRTDDLPFGPWSVTEADIDRAQAWLRERTQ